MATQPFEARLSAIEQTMLELARAQVRTEAQAERTQAQAERTQAQAERTQVQAERTQVQAERTEAQAERTQVQAERTQAQAERTDAQFERTQAQLDRMSADLQTFHADSRMFEERISTAVQSIDASVRRCERQWGELANKLGTLTEDIVVPGIPTVFRALFGEEGTVELAVRVRRRHRLDPGRMEEFDAAASGSDILLVAESKSTLKPEYLGEFRDKLARSRDFLPEAAGKQVVGLLASFYLDPSLVTAGERQGLIMVGLGTGLLQVLNTPGFVPGRF